MLNLIEKAAAKPEFLKSLVVYAGAREEFKKGLFVDGQTLKLHEDFSNERLSNAALSLALSLSHEVLNLISGIGEDDDYEDFRAAQAWEKAKDTPEWWERIGRCIEGYFDGLGVIEARFISKTAQSYPK